MKKSVILVLALSLVAVFAVGCSSGDDMMTTATQAPEVTVEATMEAAADATAAIPAAEATIEVEATDNSTVTEEATEETTPDETGNAGEAN